MIALTPQTLVMAVFAIIIGLICFQLEENYAGLQNRYVTTYLHLCSIWLYIHNIIIELELSSLSSQAFLLEVYLH